MLQKDAMLHAQKAIELNPSTAAIELCTKTIDDIDTLFVDLLDAAPHVQSACCSENGDAAQEEAEPWANQLPLPGAPGQQHQRRKSDTHPMATPTTASIAASRVEPGPEAGHALTKMPPVRLEPLGKQRTLAKLAALEAERCAANFARSTLT